jgi:hypothetical protein
MFASPVTRRERSARYGRPNRPVEHHARCIPSEPSLRHRNSSDPLPCTAPHGPRLAGRLPTPHSQPSSPSAHGTAVPRLKISSLASLAGQSPGEIRMSPRTGSSPEFHTVNRATRNEHETSGRDAMLAISEEKGRLAPRDVERLVGVRVEVNRRSRLTGWASSKSRPRTRPASRAGRSGLSERRTG